MISHGFLASKVDKYILEQHVAHVKACNAQQKEGQLVVTSRLTDAAASNEDETSIDVQQLPVSEVYSVSIYSI